MRRHTLPLVIASIVVLGTLPVWPVWAQTSCQLAPIFLMLRDQVGRERVGECNGQPGRNEAGDVNQAATHGMFTLRTSDQVAAFSDGQTTWLYGPNGLESRPSGGRLAWESAAAAASVNGGSMLTPTPTPTYASASYTSAYQATPTPTPWGQTSSGGAATATATQITSYYGQQTTGSTQTTANQTTTGAWQPPADGWSPPAATQPQYGLPAPQSNAVLPPPAPSPVILTPSELPITLTGSDSSSSKPIDLAGGDYPVHWEAQLDRGKSSCYVGSRLRRFDDQNPGALLVHTTLGSTKERTVSGQTRLFSVQPGRYVIDVTTTGCSWKLTLQAP